MRTLVTVPCAREAHRAAAHRVVVVAAGGTRLRGAGDGMPMGAALALPRVAIELVSVVPLFTGGR